MAKASFNNIKKGVEAPPHLTFTVAIHSRGCSASEQRLAQAYPERGGYGISSSGFAPGKYGVVGCKSPPG